MPRGHAAAGHWPLGVVHAARDCCPFGLPAAALVFSAPRLWCVRRSCEHAWNPCFDPVRRLLPQPQARRFEHPRAVPHPYHPTQFRRETRNPSPAHVLHIASLSCPKICCAARPAGPCLSPRRPPPLGAAALCCVATCACSHRSTQAPSASLPPFCPPANPQPLTLHMPSALSSYSFGWESSIHPPPAAPMRPSRSPLYSCHMKNSPSAFSSARLFHFQLSVPTSC